MIITEYMGLFLVVIIITIYVIYLNIRKNMELRNHVETGQQVEDVTIIKDTYVNMFLIKDGDNYIAVDTAKNADEVAQSLEKLHINPQQVKAVLLTHTDGDHVGSLSLFPNARIFLSKEEEQMINGNTARMLNRYNSLETSEYELLSDGQRLTINTLTVKCILNPGHTPGSMSFLVNNKYLFVGDAFSLEDGKISRPNPMFTKDMETALRSFKKIRNLKAQYIFTAHTGFTDNYEAACSLSML